MCTKWRNGFLQWNLCGEGVPGNTRGVESNSKTDRAGNTPYMLRRNAGPLTNTSDLDSLTGSGSLCTRNGAILVVIFDKLLSLTDCCVRQYKAINVP